MFMMRLYYLIEPLFNQTSHSVLCESATQKRQNNRVSRSLTVRQGVEPLLAALCSISPKSPFVCYHTHTHTKFNELFFLLIFLLFTRHISTSPICLFYICQVFINPPCSTRPYLPLQFSLLCKLRLVSR